MQIQRMLFDTNSKQMFKIIISAECHVIRLRNCLFGIILCNNLKCKNVKNIAIHKRKQVRSIGFKKVVKIS